MKNRAWVALAACVNRWWWVLVLSTAVVALIGVGVVLSIDVASQTDVLMVDVNPPTTVPTTSVISAVPTPPSISDKDRADLRRGAFQYQADNLSKIWTTIVQAMVGAVLAVGGYFTWRNLRVANEAQITNRFTQAIGQLGAELKDGQPNLEVRMGGIYALERIANDSPRDYWSIISVLTAYMRGNAPKPIPGAADAWGTPRLDIEAIVTVVRRRTPPKNLPEPEGLDLHATNLRWSNLRNADLPNAFLSSANMERASLYMANLEGAMLYETNLAGADLFGVNLSQADITRTYLTEAWNLTESQIRSARWQSDRPPFLPPRLVFLLDRSPITEAQNSRSETVDQSHA